MDVSINEQDNADKYNGGVDNGESRHGGNKRVKLDEPLDTGKENVEGDLAVSKSGQLARLPNANQGIPALADGEEGRDGRGRGGPVQFEFHFPEEIWLLILDMVEDSDRVNCCRALPYLDRILTESKPVFLSEQVLPLMNKWLSKTEILNCRRVCKKWCVAEDQHMYSKRAQPLQLHFNEHCKYQFSNLEKVDRFIQTFSGHTRSPFIDGTVCIETEHNEDMDMDTAYPERVIQLLRQFGKHIRIIQIRQFLHLLGPLEWYRFLQEALNNTPNLRQLAIFERGVLGNHWDEDEGDVLGLYSYMMLNPLPFIPSLEVLWPSLGNLTSEAVQNIHNMLMLPYATQLKTLSVNMTNWKDHYARGLVKLSEFTLTYLDSHENLERFLHLTAAPLKRFELTACCSLSVPVLLGVLKKFPLLEDVLIRFFLTNEGLINGEDISNLSHLKVPAVKTLQISYGGSASYNFLQMFPSLRRLTVRIGRDSVMDIKKRASEEGEMNLQLFKILEDGNIYDSNIWKLIPTLKYAKIERCRCMGPVLSGTREGYNEYLSKEN